MTPDQELSYIAAFIDGEGYVLCKRDAKTAKLQRSIGFVNTEKELFDAVTAMFHRAGFECSVRKREMNNPNHSTRWDCKLVGGKPMFERFLSLIPIQHIGKRGRLLQILAEYLTTEEAKRRRAVSRSQKCSPERRREIGLIASSRRWEGHVRAGPKRVRHLTSEQRERKNFLKRLTVPS